MDILITNDDSINASGIKALVDCARRFGNVTVVAPVNPHSGQSSALTVDSPLRIRQLDNYNGARMLTVSGTPVDCVKLALNAICDRKPDLLLAGINHGSNSGNAIIYSGTMGAALEGCMAQIPSVGFSLLDHSLSADFSLSSDMVTEIIDKTILNPLPPSVALNVNIPSKIKPLGVKCCRAAIGHWTEEYKRYDDPFNHPFYMLTGRFVNEEPDAKDTDEYWLTQGYISVVPVCPDMTAHCHIHNFSNIYNS